MIKPRLDVKIYAGYTNIENNLTKQNVLKFIEKIRLTSYINHLVTYVWLHSAPENVKNYAIFLSFKVKESSNLLHS